MRPREGQYRASLPNLRIWIRNDGADPHVRIMPDKCNDQIASSPKEEKRRFLNALAQLRLFVGKRFYLSDFIYFIIFIDLRNIECPQAPAGEGVFECRIDFGPGYRIYFGKDRDTLVILLGGGTKKRQQKDIVNAKILWKEYKRRKRQER